MTTLITRDVVIERSHLLPAFPAIITMILNTLNDPDFNLHELTDYIKHDPVFCAHVISLANAGAQRAYASSVVDIHAAASRIGMNQIKKLALTWSLASFAEKIAASGMQNFWRHSMATGICSEEISMFTRSGIASEYALIAGLMHDLGQLWLHYFIFGRDRDVSYPDSYHGVAITRTQFERFGADHAIIGAWLAEHWQLPPSVCNAIRYHHAPEMAPDEPLVQLLHVAEVLSNALNLTGFEEDRVDYLSSRACAAIGLVWNQEVQSLFGRIDARNQHAKGIFQPHGHGTSHPK